MIYTIGYSCLKPQQLSDLATRLRAVVIDTRSSPRSRKAGFDAGALSALLGGRYRWHGDVLGGRNAERMRWNDGLTLLHRDAAALSDGESMMLLCLEEAPADCHRHELALALWLLHRQRVFHVYRDEVIEATELERACLADADYAWIALDHVIADPGVLLTLPTYLRSAPSGWPWG